MPALRPEALAALHRWREVAAAAALGLAGLWTAAQGGLILAPLGMAALLLAAGWAVAAVRRVRFAQGVAAPGVVEVIEGQVTYFAPAGEGTAGGMVALPDLVELHLVARAGHRFWRLRQADGAALTIPVDAAGAEALFDAFIALPGLDSAALLAALDPAAGPGASTLPAPPVAFRRIWTRPGAGLVARG